MRRSRGPAFTEAEGSICGRISSAAFSRRSRSRRRAPRDFSWRRWRQRTRRVASARRPLPPALEEQRAAFLLLERRMARQGLGKREGETLLEYAARLEGCDPPQPEAAAQVRAFAGQRYAVPVG